jgi:hypothetical protein
MRTRIAENYFHKKSAKKYFKIKVNLNSRYDLKKLIEFNSSKKNRYKKLIDLVK